MSSPEHNEALVSPCVDEVVDALVNGGLEGLTAQPDPDDWSKILVRGADKRYSLYLRDVQDRDAPLAG